jgi:hypothetical protein
MINVKSVSRGFVGSVCSHRALRHGAMVVAMLAATSFSGASDAQRRTGGAGTQTAGDSYEIRLQRPSRVGQRGRVVVTGEKHQTMTMRLNGQTARQDQQDLRVRFEAVETVREVDSSGNATRSEYTVETFSAGTGAELVPVVADGVTITVVRANARNQAQVLVNGQPAEENVRNALEAVVSVTVNPLNDDEVFGTTRRQRPGASWPLQSAVAARSFNQSTGMTGRFTGQTRLVQRTQVQNRECLEITAEMNGTISQLPNMPPGAVVRNAQVNATMRGMFPTDVSVPRLVSNTAMTMNVRVGFQQEGQPAELELAGREVREGTYSPL